MRFANEYVSAEIEHFVSMKNGCKSKSTVSAESIRCLEAEKQRLYTLQRGRIKLEVETLRVCFVTC